MAEKKTHVTTRSQPDGRAEDAHDPAILPGSHGGPTQRARAHLPNARLTELVVPARSQLHTPRRLHTDDTLLDLLGLLGTAEAWMPAKQIGLHVWRHRQGPFVDVALPLALVGHRASDLRVACRPAAHDVEIEGTEDLDYSVQAQHGG